MILEQQPYPEDWPPVMIAAEGCPDIAGTYENAGHGGDGVPSCTECDDRPDSNKCYSNCIHSEVLHLSQILLGIDLPDDDRILVGRPHDGELRIQIDDRTREIESRTLSGDAHEFDCEGGKIWIQVPTRTETDIGSVIVVSRQVRLGKAEDGSLVGEYVEKGRGVVFIGVPAYGSDRKFIRWQAADSESHPPGIY